jgi:hypothetical protein
MLENLCSSAKDICFNGLYDLCVGGGFYHAARAISACNLIPSADWTLSIAKLVLPSPDKTFGQHRIYFCHHNGSREPLYCVRVHSTTFKKHTGSKLNQFPAIERLGR